MDAFAEELLTVLGEDVWQYGVLTSDKVSFDEGVRYACEQNYCGRYGKSWMCPPGVGEPENMSEGLLTYKNVFVFTTKHDIEDSYDVEGMAEAHKKHDSATKKIFFLCKEHGAKLLGAGGCTKCEKCTYPDAPCRFPEDAVSSVEANGINVMQLSKTIGINYINGANTVTYFSAVFYN